MIEQHTLMWVIVMMTVTAAVAWLMVALPMRIAPRASLHFAAANICLFVSILLTLQRTTEASYLYWPGSGLTGILAVLALRSGIRQLFKLPAPHLSNLVLLAIALTAYLQLPPDPASRQVFAQLFSSFMCAGLVLVFVDVFKAARKEFSRAVALAMAFPFGIIALGMGARLVTAIWLVPWKTTARHGELFDAPPALWGYTFLVLVLNITLFSCVLSRMVLKIRNYSERDHLTGLFNRRAFEQRLTMEDARARRSGSAFSLVLLDIDHFKQINDQHGHAAGDQALRHVSQLLQQTLRPFDVLARLGGEEFVILLADTEMVVAAEIAERLRVLLEANPLPWQGKPVPVQASMGYVSNRFTDCDRLLTLADKALYRAKAGGRNRCEAAEISIMAGQP